MPLTSTERRRLEALATTEPALRRELQEAEARHEHFGGLRLEVRLADAAWEPARAALNTLEQENRHLAGGRWEWEPDPFAEAT